MKAVRVIFLIASVFVLGIIAQDSSDVPKDSKKAEVSTKVKDSKSKVEKVVKIGDLPIPLEAVKPNKERYRIGFQDVLQINVYRHPELSQTVSVGRDGTILLPRINEPIVAVCKTERQLTSLVTQLYKNYLRRPFVSIRTIEQRSQPFAVIGAVNKPGNFYLNQRIRLLSLLSLAGGQDVEKSGSRVQVARIGNLSACNPTDDKDKAVEFYAYELNEVLNGNENPWMQPGDIVSVLEASEVYVIGEVFEPAKILLKEPITLSEAIARAGGLSKIAKTTKIIIQRKEKGNPIRTELVYNLKDIKARKIPDPFLQANDIVEVTSSGKKVFKKNLWDIFTKGLPNVFYRLPL